MVQSRISSIALAFACAACGSSDSTGDAEKEAGGEMADALLAPPDAGRGVQFTMTTEIAPGDEVEHCKFVRTGDETLFVNRDEIRFSEGSHHVLVYNTPYESIPTENDRGDSVDTSRVFDCSNGVQDGWTVEGLIGASQSFDGESSLSLPEGVGVRVPPNAVVLLNAHYINTTTEVLKPNIAVNLHSIPEAELEHEGGLIFWYHPFLKAPANGTSTMRASCPIDDDIHIANAQSHMHARGVGYRAEVVSPSGERNLFYEGTAWEDVPVESYDPTLDVAAGSRIEWECQYENSESEDVYQGTKTTDEMCMLIGSYYPRDDRIGFCQRDDNRDTQFMGARWDIGSGTASCAATFQCIAERTAGADMTGPVPDFEAIAGITECLLDSDPAVSEPISDALGCMAATSEDTDPLQACGDEIATCQSQ